MGMKIDKAIIHGEEQLEIFGGEHKEFIETAINTMHKYQKMVEILEKVWNKPACMIDESECLNEIMETYRTVRW